MFNYTKYSNKHIVDILQTFSQILSEQISKHEIFDIFEYR